MPLHGQAAAVLALRGARWAACSWLAILLRRRVTDPVLETVVALVTPYAAYAGPGAACVAGDGGDHHGLVIGGRRERITTAQTRLQLHSVYQTVIFLLETVVFSLIGLQLLTLIHELSHGEPWFAEALAVAGR